MIGNNELEDMPTTYLHCLLDLHDIQVHPTTWFSGQYGETLNSCTVFSLGVQFSGKIYTCAISLHFTGISTALGHISILMQYCIAFGWARYFIKRM